MMKMIFKYWKGWKRSAKDRACISDVYKRQLFLVLGVYVAILFSHPTTGLGDFFCVELFGVHGFFILDVYKRQVKACVDSALQLGLPEARLPLADATILLCTAPKSNAGVLAIDAAMADVKNGKTGDIPAYLKDSHYSGAKKLGRDVYKRQLYPLRQGHTAARRPWRRQE